MSRRVLAHGACRFPGRWAVNRTRRPLAVPSASPPSRALHGTKPSAQNQQQQEEARKAPPAASTEESGGGTFGGLPARTAAGRVGRGLLVGMPVVGAGFALHLARKDFRRARSELKSAHVRLALAEMSYQRDVSRTAGARQQDGGGAATILPDRPTLETSAARCFGVTAAVDSGIVAAHVVTLYGLYQGWEPDPIVNAGIAAMIGAVLSTGGGVRGEYLVASRGLLKGGRAKGSQDDGGEDDSGRVAHAAAEERGKPST